MVFKKDNANPSKKQKKKDLKLLGIGLVYLLPVIVFLGTFMIYPILKTMYFSFFEVGDGGVILEFIGIDNYVSLIKSEDFRHSLWVTLLFVIYTVPAEIIISLLLAVLANEKLKGIGFFRTIFSSTLAVSVAAGSIIFLFFYHPSMGTFNSILNTFGISGIDWLTNPKWALPAIALTSIWMHIGINFIIMLAGLQNVPEELYESAEMDGAGFMKKLRSITVPMISPTIFFLSIIGVINSFESFGQIDILTSGGPSGSTNVIVYSIYQEAFKFGNFGYASAQAVTLFIIMLIVTLIQFKFGEKRVHYQ